MRNHRRAVVVLLIALAWPACSSLAGPYREYAIRFDGGAPPALDQNPSDAELIDAVPRPSRRTST